MKVRVEKKTSPQKKLLVRNQKKVDWLTPDEKMQPIPWTEPPTGALVGAGSLWPKQSNLFSFLGTILHIFVWDQTPPRENKKPPKASD